MYNIIEVRFASVHIDIICKRLVRYHDFCSMLLAFHLLYPSPATVVVLSVYICFTRVSLFPDVSPLSPTGTFLAICRLCNCIGPLKPPGVPNLLI